MKAIARPFAADQTVKRRRPAVRGVGIEPLESRTMLSESATAQISLVSTSGTGANSVFHYDINVTNTGTTNLGTFWFAWVPGEDFLPSVPSAVSGPTGWSNTLTGSENSTDGTAILWVATSTAITPGNSLGGFDFTTTDSPAVLAGMSPSHPTEATTISFVYGGQPFSDAGFQLVATPPATTVASKTSLVSSASSVTSGSPVTFTATVAAVNGSGPTPTGTVSFSQDGNALGTANLGSNGTTALTLSTLPVGTDHITASYGGDSNYFGSASAALTQTITPRITTVASKTSLISSAPSITSGSPVTFTATVAPASGSGPTPTGTVSFSQDGNSLGTANLGSNGTAAVTVTTLPVGTDHITATYGGSSSYNGSASAALTQTITARVTSVASKTSLISSASSVTSGSPVTFTATVAAASGSGPTPTGAVSFSQDGNALGTANLGSNGTAALTVSTLPVGTDHITATYGGSSSYNGSASAALTQTITPRVTTAASKTSLVSSATSATSGAPVTFTATVAAASGSGPTPTGTVSFSQDGNTLGTANIGSNGTAALTVSTLPVGTDHITASYGGDTNYIGSASGTLTQTITPRVTTVASKTSLVSSAPSANSGSPVTFTATVAPANGSGPTPTGTVSFSQDGSALKTANLGSNGTAALTVSTLPVGTDHITASYGGDSNYVGSASAALTQTITATRSPSSESATAPISLTSTTGTPASPVYHYDIQVTDTGTTNIGTFWFAWIPGEDFLPSVPSAVSNPTGWGNTLTGSENSTDGTAIEWVASSHAITPGNTLGGFDFTTTDSPTVLAGLAPSHPSEPVTTTFIYAGGPFSDAGFQFVVTPPVTTAASTTSLVSSAPSATSGTPITFTATVASVSGSGPTPTGTVSFSQDGSALGTANVGSNGRAVLTVSSLPVGTDHITATYSGDSNYGGSASAAVSQTITPPANAIATTTALTSSSATAAPGAAVTFTATITPAASGPAPTGVVTFTVNGSSLGTASVQGNGTATLTTSELPSGSDSIAAAYGGDATYANSASAPFTETVAQSGALGATIAKSTLPASVVAEQPVNGVVTVDLTNLTSATVKGRSTIQIFAATGAGIGGSSIMLAQVIHATPVTTARPAVVLVPVRIHAGLLPAGTYTLFARVIDPSGNSSDSPAGPALSAAAPFVSLSETLVRSGLPASAASGATAHGTTMLSVTNNGNIITPGITTITLQATANGVLNSSAIQLASANVPLRIRPGKSARVSIALRHLPQLAPGAYTVLAEVTDANGGISSVLVGTLTINAAA